MWTFSEIAGNYLLYIWKRARVLKGRGDGVIYTTSGEMFRNIEANISYRNVKWINRLKRVNRKGDVRYKNESSNIKNGYDFQDFMLVNGRTLACFYSCGNNLLWWCDWSCFAIFLIALDNRHRRGFTLRLARYDQPFPVKQECVLK